MLTKRTKDYLALAVRQGSGKTIKVTDLKVDGSIDSTVAFEGHPSAFYKLVVTNCQTGGDTSLLPANSAAILKAAVATPGLMYEFHLELRDIAGL